MRGRHERVLWLGTAGLLVVAAAEFARRPVEAVGPERSAAAGLRYELRLSDAESVDAWTQRVAERDPFRLEHRPPSIRYGGSSVSQIPVTHPARPSLSLVGTLGGPPWQAVVDGIPAQPTGAVVREGQRLGELMVIRVSRDTVIIEGADTTWVLTLREPWR